jgi:hypothetical protein
MRQSVYLAHDLRTGWLWLSMILTDSAKEELAAIRVVLTWVRNRYRPDRADGPILRKHHQLREREIVTR